MPSKGPFIGRPKPDDDSAVPEALVPGAAALLPKAPPVIDMPVMDIWEDPIPPLRANAAVVERLTHKAMHRRENFFMPRLRQSRD